MATITVTKNSNTRDVEKDFKEATTHEDLDTVLKKVKKLDNTCAFKKCKTKTTDFAINCQYCSLRFCTSHGLPEIHGCGEAVRRDEKRKYLHPQPKLTEHKHEQASTKLSMKLKQMQSERKSKQGFSTKGKKK